MRVITARDSSPRGCASDRDTRFPPRRRFVLARACLWIACASGACVASIAASGCGGTDAPARSPAATQAPGSPSTADAATAAPGDGTAVVDAKPEREVAPVTTPPESTPIVLPREPPIPGLTPAPTAEVAASCPEPTTAICSGPLRNPTQNCRTVCPVPASCEEAFARQKSSLHSCIRAALDADANFGSDGCKGRFVVHHTDKGHQSSVEDKDFPKGSKACSAGFDAYVRCVHGVLGTWRYPYTADGKPGTCQYAMP